MTVLEDAPRGVELAACVRERRATMARPQHVVQFIQKIKPSAVIVQLFYGVPASVTIAQAALETGWGQSVHGNAYFGVKGRAPSGASTTFTTHEEVNGKKIKIQDKFRAYDSILEAALDYGQYLKTNARYSAAFQHTDDSYKFVDGIAKAGYASDHAYAQKLKSIIKHNNLQEYDGDVLLFIEQLVSP
jgi:flagellar protein FlgJ